MVIQGFILPKAFKAMAGYSAVKWSWSQSEECCFIRLSLEARKTWRIICGNTLCVNCYTVVWSKSRLGLSKLLCGFSLAWEYWETTVSGNSLLVSESLWFGDSLVLLRVLHWKAELAEPEVYLCWNLVIAGLRISHRTFGIHHCYRSQRYSFDKHLYAV